MAGVRPAIRMLSEVNQIIVDQIWQLYVLKFIRDQNCILNIFSESETSAILQRNGDRISR